MFKNLFKSKKEKELAGNTKSIYSEEQLVVTQDNENCRFSILIHYDIIDHKTYKSNSKPQIAIECLAVVIARNILGNYDLEDIMNNKEMLNDEIKTAANEGSLAFGINIVDVMITQIYSTKK